MKALIVDDSPALRLLLRQILINLGHEFIEAINGQLALEQCKLHQFDVIFMDIEMPVMNGVDASRQIRETLQISSETTPIIALTAYEYDIFKEKYPETFFDSVLTKPYSLEKIKETLQGLC